MIRWKVNKYNYDEKIVEKYLDVVKMSNAIIERKRCKNYSPGITVINQDTMSSRVIMTEDDWIEYVEFEEGE